MGPWEGAPWTPRRMQAEALPIVIERLGQGRRGVVVACTGSGKAILIAEVVSEVQRLGLARRVVVTTPTQRLVGQLGGTLRERLGKERVGLFYADAKEADAEVIVACNASAGRLASILGGGLDLWIADEAHRTESAGLLAAQEALSPRLVLGLTATPFLGRSGAKLSSFTEVFYRYTLIDGQRDGVLAPYIVIGREDDRDRPITEIVRDMIVQHTAGYGYCNAKSIVDAEQMAAWLTLNGVPSAAVHSRQKEAEQDRRLAALRRGWLRCVVYPSLLGEGFDDPGASFLVMARDVKSPVRVIQEVGRVMRKAPGKKLAVILDIHGAVTRVDLLTAEALGTNAPDVGNDAEDAEDGGRERVGAAGGDWQPATVRPLNALTQWAAHLVQAAQVDGLLPLRFRWSESRRAVVASAGQLSALLKMRGLAKRLPEGHAELAGRVCEGGHAPTSGAAGDLLDVLNAMRGCKGGWKPRLPVWLPDLAEADLAEVMEQGELSAAGLVWSGQRAVVVVRGRRTLYTHVRTAGPGETGTAAGVEALCQAAALRPGVPVQTADGASARLFLGSATAQKPEVILALRGRPMILPPVRIVDGTEAKKAAFRAAAGAAAHARKKAEEAARRAGLAAGETT